jgi:integrase
VLTVPKVFAKTNKERSIPITGDALEVIWRRSSGLEKGEQLFARLDYKWHCNRFWQEVVRPTMGWGPDEVWYGIRHTFATRLCELNVNLKTVQELMGHTNINQTAQYAKATDDAKANAIEALSGMTGQRDGGSVGFQMSSNDKERTEESFLKIRAV